MGTTYTGNMELAQQDGNATVDPTVYGGNFGKLSQQFDRGNVVSSGVSTSDRKQTGNMASIASGSLILSYFTSYKGNVAMAISTQVQVRTTGTTSSGLTSGYVALYSVSSVDQSLTLVAQTASTTTWSTTFTGVNLNWTTPYQMVMGQRYALGILFIGTTPPSLLGSPGSTDFALNATPPRICGQLTGQTSLPTTVTEASLTTIGVGPFGIVLP